VHILDLHCQSGAVTAGMERSRVCVTHAPEEGGRSSSVLACINCALRLQAIYRDRTHAPDEDVRERTQCAALAVRNGARELAVLDAHQSIGVTETGTSTRTLAHPIDAVVDDGRRTRTIRARIAPSPTQPSRQGASRESLTHTPAKGALDPGEDDACLYASPSGR
jgi:hypothetical protein